MSEIFGLSKVSSDISSCNEKEREREVQIRLQGVTPHSVCGDGHDAEVDPLGQHITEVG